MTDVARVTESVPPDASVDRSVVRRQGRIQHGRYLPSEQVLTELASLGPDLGKLADDLRMRLSEPSDGVPPCAV